MDKVHGNTIKAADIAIAKKQISPASHRAVLAGEISLARAKELGRSGTPEGTPTGAEVQETATGTPGRPCLCGCGGTTRGGRFLPGHDARLHAELKRNLEKDPLLRNERFTEEQRAYAKERGLI